VESNAQERNEITATVSKAYLKFHSLLPNIGSQNQEIGIIWALGKSPPVCTRKQPGTVGFVATKVGKVAGRGASQQFGSNKTLKSENTKSDKNSKVSGAERSTNTHLSLHHQTNSSQQICIAAISHISIQIGKLLKDSHATSPLSESREVAGS
jgi:hypothetical protein